MSYVKLVHSQNSHETKRSGNSHAQTHKKQTTRYTHSLMYCLHAQLSWKTSLAARSCKAQDFDTLHVFMMLNLFL